MMEGLNGLIDSLHKLLTDNKPLIVNTNVVDVEAITISNCALTANRISEIYELSK